MDLLLILTYTALCVVVFKVFKIPLNKWTVPTAVLGGIVMIGALLLVMNYNHPYTETLRQYYVTTPIIPEVRGRVIEVTVKDNQPVKQGDVLFKIDPKPFEDRLRGVREEVQAAQIELDRADQLLQSRAGSQSNRDQAAAKLANLNARLDEAEFELDQTVVRAPDNGFVTQIALRPGMMAQPLSAMSTLTFVHEEPGVFVGWFRQNSLLRLEAGHSAEVALDALPGEIYEAKIEKVFPVIGEGQIRPQADLLRYGGELVPGRVAVALKITDPDFPQDKLPMGAFGQAAIYSDHFEHVGVMRKILLRMAGWMNYVFPIH